MSRLTLVNSLAVCLLAIGNTLSAGQKSLPRSTPEAQGVSSAVIREFVEAADKEVATMHSFMLVRHGQVIAEGWWNPESADRQHVLWSLSKSFTSTAVGLAIAEGKLRVDDEVLKFFPEDSPAEPSANLKAMRVADLLRMSTGHQTEPPRRADETWVKTFLAHPVPFKPGTHFMYNTSATFMQSAIVQKATGETVLDYLRPRLFEPLGIEQPKWDANAQGITVGGYGLHIRTEDIAKFGQLYLQKGKWNGKQLIPAEWIAAATDRQTSNGSNPQSDWDEGYGYQFWRCRHGAYRGDGKDGQFCIVLPEQDAVIAMTADTADMQGQLNVVWNKLLAAFHPAPLPEAPESLAKLQQSLANLHVRERPQPPRKPTSTEKWEKEIAAFEEHDKRQTPPKGALLFIGSSTIRLWESLADDFPQHHVINRGFGGSQITDCTAFVERIVFPYEPSAIFFRTGGNDLHAGLSADQVFADYRSFVSKVRSKLPGTEIVFLGLCPSPARAGEAEATRWLNQRVEEFCRQTPHLKYIEMYNLSLDDQGRLRGELFVDDKLHFSPAGYKLLAEKVRPYLPKGPAPSLRSCDGESPNTDGDSHRPGLGGTP